MLDLSSAKVDVWAAQIEDEPGGLAKLLGTLAGANLECLIARRDPSNAGKGVAFLTPVKGADVRKAAMAGGLKPPESAERALSQTEQLNFEELLSED